MSLFNKSQSAEVFLQRVQLGGSARHIVFNFLPLKGSQVLKKIFRVIMKSIREKHSDSLAVFREAKRRFDQQSVSSPSV